MAIKFQDKYDVWAVDRIENKQIYCFRDGYAGEQKIFMWNFRALYQAGKIEFIEDKCWILNEKTGKPEKIK